MRPGSRYYRSVRISLLVIAALLATLTACGTPEEDRIVIKDPRPSGKSQTYAQVRDVAAKTYKEIGGYDCTEFAASLAENPGMEFPSGKDLYVKACEEGQMQPK